MKLPSKSQAGAPAVSYFELTILSSDRYKRANAAFVALVRNNEREAMRDSMRSVEMRGNRRWGYPWFVHSLSSVIV